MSRKTSSRASNSASSTSTKAGVKSKAKPGLSTIEKPKPFPAAGKPAPGAATAKPQPEPASSKPKSAHESQTPATRPKATSENEAANQLLNRAERDITSAIDSLNNQMNVALTALSELASAHAERGKAVVRTAPLDRATATFHRLVSEVVDDQLNEMLPPLIVLRNEMKQWSADGEEGSPESDFHRRGLETLDSVLALAGVAPFEARSGQSFDSLIHLAVGEAHREDLPDGVVADCLVPGFRSTRGKVLALARVRINRR